jgi:hypothetical protein
MSASPQSRSPLPRLHSPFRFHLRTLFILIAVVGVASGIARSVVHGDQALGLLFIGIAVFCYGGIIALPCYAFVGSLAVLTTKTTWGQRTGEIVAAIIGAMAWISFVVIAMRSWPQVCVLFSIIIIAIITWLVRTGWNTPEGPSPESSLQRLLAAKESCHHKAPREH